MDEQPGGLKTSGVRINVRNQSSYCNTVTIPNATAQDASLSWAARGLLAYMLSMPANWAFHEHDLVHRSPQGRDHLRSIVRELEAHGYLERHQARDEHGRQAAAQWRVWDRPQHQRDTTTAPLTGKPSTENPSTDRCRATAAKSPQTENPSTVEMAPLTGKPSTAEPSTENPSTYKRNNLEIKPIPPLTSLRDVPPHGGERARIAESGSAIQHSDRTPTTSNGQDGAPEATRSARKAAQPASAATDTTTAARGASEGRRAQRSASAPLPDYAEPVRPLLEAWWRLRRKRHRAETQTALTARSLNALAYAHELGVLEAFAELAAESGWLSLGFNGHRDYIAKLAAERSLDDCGSHPESCMVPRQSARGLRPRSTTRQADAAERAIAMFSATPEPPGTCSPLPISSMPSPA